MGLFASDELAVDVPNLGGLGGLGAGAHYDQVSSIELRNRLSSEVRREFRQSSRLRSNRFVSLKKKKLLSND